MIDAILAEFWSSNGLVHLGAALYLVAFLFRDQLYLRSFVVAGDIIYVLYYYFAPETPLWGGIFWSVLFILVNARALALMAADRKHLRLTPDEKALSARFETLSPGEFRALLRIARFTVADDRTQLTTEGEPLDKLHVVTDGTVRVRKKGRDVARDQNAFVGEIAFLLGSPASATVIVEESSRYFSWPAAALKSLIERRPEFGVALSQALNRNLAEKLADAGAGVRSGPEAEPDREADQHSGAKGLISAGREDQPAATPTSDQPLGQDQ